MQISRSQAYAGDLSAAHARHTQAPIGWRVRNGIQHRARSLGQLTAAKAVGLAFGLVTIKPQLAGVLFQPDRARLDGDQWNRLLALLRQNVPVFELAAAFGGRTVDYGVLSRRVITDTGVGFLVDGWQNLTELENMKYHGVGTGTNAENQTDSALQTESTTILNPDSTRATGSTTEGATANVFRSVGTVTFDGSGAITEHGLFSQAATGGGVLWDRSVFSAINVVNLDSIQFTYDMTASANG